MLRPWWIVGAQVLLAAVALAPLPEVWRALAGVPAVLLLPGLPWAIARFGHPGERVVAAFWISALAAIPEVALARLTGLGAVGVLATAVLVGVLGVVVGSPRAGLALPRQPLAPGPRVGLAFAGLCVALTAWGWRDTIARPLDACWWFPPAEEAWSGGGESLAPGRGAGWAARQELGEHAYVLQPRSDHPYLLGPAHGPLVLAFRGRLGAKLEVEGRTYVVRADPVVDSEEGPVPRYLERGTVGVRLDLDLDAGERLAFHVSDPLDTLVYVLPHPEAVWELHEAGALRFVHYYQLLNMVEQVRWARALGTSRWVTDVQPPLWSWVVASPLEATRGELPTANVVLLLLVLVIALTSGLVLEALAPEAPVAAWLLPGLAAAMHARLLYEPGSAAMPDSLYTAAVLLAARSVARGAAGGHVAGGLLAQLSRYPGTLLTALLAAFAGQWRMVRAQLAAVFVVASLFGVAGLMGGALGGWLDTVWWETIPEHWHGEASPAALLPRIPAFLYLWFAYAGGAPLLALLRWPPGTRMLLGTAFAYATLLCTVDHSPSHYFLPLLHLSSLAVVTTATSLSHRATRTLLCVAALAGLWISILIVPITG